MHFTAPRILIAALAIALSGCLLLNDVRSFSAGSPVDSGRAIIVYGIGVEGTWSTPKFAVALDEYSVERESVTGNCSRFNRMEAAVTAVPGPTQYFAFDAKPGHYVYSAFNGGRFARAQTTRAFKVPEGRVVYLGDFVYSREQAVEIRHDPNSMKAALNKSLPDISRNLIVADAMPVPPVGVFTCTP